jgi:hypothetical protein
MSRAGDLLHLRRGAYAELADGVLETDPEMVHLRLLKATVPQSAEEVLIAEKRREERLRELGWMVIRWTWQDLTRPEALIGRLRKAFERGRQLT